MRTEYQTKTQYTPAAPSGSRWPGSLVAVAIAIAVVAAACGSTEPEATDTVATIASAESTTTSEPATTTSMAPTVAALQPHELADRLFTAYAGLDPAAWRVLFAPDAGVFDAMDWDSVEDFDGDGVTTFADWQQFKIAMHGAVGFDLEWECESVSADEAQCAVAGTDAFYELAGTAPPPVELVQQFDAGLWVAEKSLPPTDPEEWDDQKAEAEGGRDEELTRYEDWVAETYPDRYSAVFDGPGGEELVDWVTLPSAIPIHEELLAEYLDQSTQATTADLAPTPTTGTITVVAKDWVGLEGQQVLAAIVPGAADERRSRWHSTRSDGGYYEPWFVGSVSWGSVESDQFSGEAVVRNAKPFDWFRGSEAALEQDAAQLEPGTYTVVLMASGRPGPIANWADDHMPFAPTTCFVETEVAAGETTTVSVAAFPSCSQS